MSGQEVVDAIESVPVNPGDNRPLKDVVISHCGQLVRVTSRESSRRKSDSSNFGRLETHKAKKRKASTADENASESSSDSTDNEEKSKKKKKKSKHKKKEKHQRKSEKKGEEASPVKETAAEKSNELSAKDIMGLKTSINPDEIPEIPAHKFLMRANPPTENSDAPNSR